MESVINELWYGSIIPQEAIRINSEEMKGVIEDISRYSEELEKSFTDEQRKTFQKLEDLKGEYSSRAEAAIFEYAFKLGSRLMMEIKAER